MRRLYILFSLIFIVALASCAAQPIWLSSEKARKEVPSKLISKMSTLDMAKNSPVLLRIFKKENLLEIWKQQNTGEFALLTTYKICSWSGKLGPKYMLYDRQTPEGIYEIGVNNMNALSHYYLAINIGYPNEYDVVNHHTGDHLMIHGGCSSSGCYAMGDKNISEIYALVRDAFLGGQNTIQIQAYPFRMTARNMALYRSDNNFTFWSDLKKGYDLFNITHFPLLYHIKNRLYVFDDFLNVNLLEEYNNFNKHYIKEYNFYVAHTPKNYKSKNPKLRGIKGLSEANTVAKWMKKVIKTGVESKSEPLL